MISLIFQPVVMGFELEAKGIHHKHDPGMVFTVTCGFN